MGQNVNLNTSGVGPALGFDTSTTVAAGRTNTANLPAALRGAQLGEPQPSRLHRAGQFFGKALLTTLNICTLGIPKFVVGRVKLALLRNSEGRLDEKCQVAVAKSYKFGDLIHQISRVGVPPSRLQEHVKGFLTGMNDRLAEAMVKTGALPGGKKSAASLGEGDFEAFQMALNEFAKNVKPEELERFQRYGEVLGGIQIEAKGQDEPLRMMCATLREKLGLSDMEAAQTAPVAPEQPAPQASTVAPDGAPIPEDLASAFLKVAGNGVRTILESLESAGLNEQGMALVVETIKESMVSARIVTAGDIESASPMALQGFQKAANLLINEFGITDIVENLRHSQAATLGALEQSKDAFTATLATELLRGRIESSSASSSVPAGEAPTSTSTRQAAPLTPDSLSQMTTRKDPDRLVAGFEAGFKHEVANSTELSGLNAIAGTLNMPQNLLAEKAVNADSAERLRNFLTPLAMQLKDQVMRSPDWGKKDANKQFNFHFAAACTVARSFSEEQKKAICQNASLFTDVAAKALDYPMSDDFKQGLQVMAMAILKEVVIPDKAEIQKKLSSVAYSLAMARDKVFQQILKSENNDTNSQLLLLNYLSLQLMSTARNHLGRDISPELHFDAARELAKSLYPEEKKAIVANSQRFVNLANMAFEGGTPLSADELLNVSIMAHAVLREVVLHN